MLALRSVTSGMIIGLLTLAWTTIGPRAARAADEARPLYQAQAIVTGTGETNRQIGFRLCLRDVLVQVSGDQRVLAEALAKRAEDDAATMIDNYRYHDRLEGVPVHDEQGTHDRPHDLTCIFDKQKVDALLARMHRKPWPLPRPRLTMFLRVTTAAKTFLLTKDGTQSPYMLQSLLAAALPMTMSVDVPTEAAIEHSGLNAGNLDRAEPSDLFAAARDAGGDLPLVGDLVWSDKDLGWVASWRLDRVGATTRWGERGISFDDAFRDAVKGAMQALSGHGDPM